ncbi:MAG: alpha/beta fold hydrolase [Silvanigrellales bacterium]|jgi:pimeloyl-ACP methyl ester carboxylesterase|nr:alpha/beta fold hydrolase [Silvanigrellales bacterium]
MRVFALVLSFLFVLHFGSSEASAEVVGVSNGTTSCGAFQAQSGIESRFCLQSPKAAEPDALVLFLHGLGGDEKTWQNYGLTRRLQRALEERGLQLAVLTPSFGPFWLLKETAAPSGDPALMPVVEELLEATLARFRPGLPVVLVGTSLGGYNGMQFYFKRPHRFDAFAFAGPAIVDASPLGNEDDIVRHYVDRTRAKVSSARTIVRSTRDRYKDEDDFRAHDPLALARTLGPLDKQPPLFLQVGQEDHFGFQSGTSLLQALLGFSGAPVEFALLSGGRGFFDHVEMDVPRTAAFLERSLRRP